jgi:hypothetical protein
LQAFTYCQLVSHVKSSFFDNYKIDQAAKFIPSVLVFYESECGKEIRTIKQYANLIKLIQRLNITSLEEGNGRIRLFEIANTIDEIKKSLCQEEYLPGKPKIKFSEGFQPSIKEFQYE